MHPPIFERENIRPTAPSWCSSIDHHRTKMKSRTRDDVIRFVYISNSYSLVIKVRDVVRIRFDKVVSTESHSTNFTVYWCTFAFVGRAIFRNPFSLHPK